MGRYIIVRMGRGVMDSLRQRIVSQVTEATLSMLKHHQSIGHLNRTFMLREHARMLDEMKSGMGHFKDYSQEHKEFVEVRIYLELFERLCQAIEDLTCLCHGLLGKLSDFPQRILSSPSPKNVLQNMSRDNWSELLRYIDVQSLPIEQTEREFLVHIRQNNIDACEKLTEFLMSFIEQFWVFYNKYKHGNTLLSGFQTIELDGEKTFFIAALFNTKELQKVKGLIVNRTIYNKWQMLFNYVVLLAKELVDRTMLMIETNNTLVVEHRVFYPLGQQDSKRLQSIVEKCMCGVEITSIEINLVAQLSLESYSNQLDLYKKLDTAGFPWSGT